MTPYTTRRRVEFADTDLAGIMHFANFFKFMESAEHDFLRSVGLSVIWSEGDERLGFPRVSASCDYLSPARYEDVLDVVVTVDRIGEKSVTYGFEFRRGSELIARGKLVTASCKVTDGKIESLPVPQKWREKLK
jgi:acyl-CoA thioester hydrolase